MINCVRQLVQFCVKENVKVIANQKVVGPEMKDIFRQNQILVLERLGREGIHRLKSVSRPVDLISTDISRTPLILESFSETSKLHKGTVKVIFFKIRIFKRSSDFILR